MDARKKEIVGPYKNGGGEYRPRGDPEQVNVHDFIDPDLGKARPVRGLRHRRQHRIGKAAYPGAAQLFSFVSMNWRDRHLTSHEVIVSAIGATTTRTGLKVRPRLDEAV